MQIAIYLVWSKAIRGAISFFHNENQVYEINNKGFYEPPEVPTADWTLC